MFEQLTEFLPMLEGTDPDYWTASERGESSRARLLEAIGRFTQEHRELNLCCPPGMPEKDCLRDGSCDANLSALDGRTVVAMVLQVAIEDAGGEAFLACLESGRMARWLSRLREIDEAGTSEGSGTAPLPREAMAQSILLGLACGDALGVPVEFSPRGSFEVSGMQGWGTHSQPPGTWSDDTSLALAFAASLVPGGFDVQAAGRNFRNWLFKACFTPFGKVFDAGSTTVRAINAMKSVPSPELAGCRGERDNGNGSLMRIAPLVLPLLDVPEPAVRFETVRKASSLTHAHPLSCACCFVFVEYLLLLAGGRSKEDAYRKLCVEFAEGFPFIGDTEAEKLAIVLKGLLTMVPRPAVQSGGYVLHTLEASLWCLLTTESYAEAVLKAVNLGSDTDTTGAVAGAAAGLCYGVEGIPSVWLGQLAKAEEIRRMARHAARAILP